MPRRDSTTGKNSDRLIKFLKKIGWFYVRLQPFLQKSRTIKVRKNYGIIFSHTTPLTNFFSEITKKTKKKYKRWLKQLKKRRKSFRKKKRGRPKKKILTWRKYFKIIAGYPWKTFFSLTITVLILISAHQTYEYIFKDLPMPTDLTKREQIVSTKILDRKGRLLYSIYKDENRTLIPLSQVPPHMIDATIAIEDQNFYKHHGFSIKGITRAIISNSQGEPVQGGSTITQQLVKNTLLNPERTARRKIREILLAIMVENVYTKDEILEMYFNEIPYGGSTYGVEEAARRFFGKSAKDLTLAESALLAGLPAAPSAYSPFGPTPESSEARQAEVLRRMVEEGFITQEEADQAKLEELHLAQDFTNIQAPHFVMYVRNLLAEQYGEDVLTQGGLEVRTTLDLDIQNMAQQAVSQEIETLKRLKVTNGAALVTNPKTGEILAMVGSTDYFDFAHDGQVNVTTRPRQPGSSIKPLTYATAFELGKLTPNSIIQDAPIRYDIVGSKPYAPQNYDGKFHGNVTAREALASSYNIPAVKTLASIGVNTLIDKGQEVGISTWNNRSRFGLSLTLGGGEILMTDMAKVYGTFANSGQTVDLNPILQVTNYKGTSLYYNTCAITQTHCQSERTFDPRVAFQITDILSDNKARTPAFGPQSVLNIPSQQVAVKTGTTNNLRDNWTIGYTTDYVVAVWVGNNDNQPMSYVASGITGASPIWNNIMRALLSEKQPHIFPEPSGLIKVKICKTTGTLTCTGCPQTVEEYYIPGTEPTKACSPQQFLPKPSPDPNQKPSRNQILEGVQVTN